MDYRVLRCGLVLWPNCIIRAQPSGEARRGVCGEGMWVWMYPVAVSQTPTKNTGLTQSSVRAQFRLSGVQG